MLSSSQETQNSSNSARPSRLSWSKRRKRAPQGCGSGLTACQPQLADGESCRRQLSEKGGASLLRAPADQSHVAAGEDGGSDQEVHAALETTLSSLDSTSSWAQAATSTPWKDATNGTETADRGKRI